MKELPSKLQFRVKAKPGFTHTTEEMRDVYRVKWARGFVEDLGYIPATYFAKAELSSYIDKGEWIVVDDAPKQKDEEVSTKHLPDEFYFDTACGVGCKAVKRDSCYQVTWPGDDEGTTYGMTVAQDCVREGHWRILDKKPLSAEQQKAIKQMEEQISALDNSIKLNEQTIHHHELLIGNYKARQDELRNKIAELEAQ